MLRAPFVVGVAIALAATVAHGHPVADPMTLLEIRHSKPVGEGSPCPDAGPCVVGGDFAYIVKSRSWNHYYVADFGTPSSPLRLTSDSDAELFEHAALAIRAALADGHARSALLSCDAVVQLPGLAGVGPTVRAHLRVQPGIRPLPAASPPQVGNVVWAAEGVPRPTFVAFPDPPPEMFSAAELRGMTGTTFRQPTLRYRTRWTTDNAPRCAGDTTRCREQVTVASVFALYSPESATVYLLDATTSMPQPQFDATYAARRRATALTLSATLAALGAKEVDVELDALCELASVLPNQAWFPIAM